VLDDHREVILIFWLPMHKTLQVFLRRVLVGMSLHPDVKQYCRLLCITSLL